ncbi:MAG: hypothetical protein KF700_11480 [Hyphomonadaceae bacterium]|nr:hypothetical protein [Hyphomonadaceae bacterium]
MVAVEAPAGASVRRHFDIETIACVCSVVLLCALAVATTPIILHALPWQIAPWQIASAFGAACAPALLTSWIVSINNGSLPARPGAAPALNHISGWSFLLLAVPIALVVVLALWAAASPDSGRTINANWGVGVTIGLAALFLFAAWAPSLNLGARARPAIAVVGPIVAPFGILLSIIDSLLVFVVAPAAGASRRSWQMRYFTLFGVLLPCAYMGYWLAAPWGLTPLIAGFVVAISISRRWAWVEDDRELAMLNGRFSGAHLRIGFDQDLRDEAMLSFMSMFFLVPLALRQIEGWQHVFNMGGRDFDDMLAWIAFYGAELAKAVPFVDWAEIYNVHGDAGINIGENPMARHAVFITRVLVDLVFLAALLQALSIAARNAKQRELFNSGVLHRLDPFIEKVEFRKLVRRGDDGAWRADEQAIAAFPHYDSVRLGELSSPHQLNAIRVAADALRVKQGGATSAEFHEELMRRVRTRPDREAIMEVVQAIRGAGPQRQVLELDQVRRALKDAPRMVEARAGVMRLIVEAPQSRERTIALLEAIQAGPLRDSLGPVRTIAIAGLALPAANDEPGVRALLRHAAKDGDTHGERRAAAAVLAQIGAA